MQQLQPYKKEGEGSDPTDTGPTAYKEQLKPAFLEQFGKLGTISSACSAVGIDRTTVYRWRKQDRFFDESFRLKNLDITDDLERSALDRAKAGDTTLTIFLLKTRDPQRFNDRFMPKIEQIDINELVQKMITAAHKTILNFCPHCQHSLDFKNNLARELDSLARSESNS